MEVPLLAVERTQDLPSTPPGMEEAVEFARVASEVLAAITGLEVEAMDPAAAASLGLEVEALVLALDDTLVQQEARLLSARRTSEESMVHSSTHLSKVTCKQKLTIQAMLVASCVPNYLCARYAASF